MNCRCPEFLVYESSVAYIDAAGEAEPWWEITYWCVNCDSFHGQFSLVAPPEQPPIIAE